MADWHKYFGLFKEIIVHLNSVPCGLYCVTNSLNYFSLRRNFWFSPSNCNTCISEGVGRVGSGGGLFTAASMKSHLSVPVCSLERRIRLAFLTAEPNPEQETSTVPLSVCDSDVCTRAAAWRRLCVGAETLRSWASYLATIYRRTCVRSDLLCMS